MTDDETKTRIADSLEKAKAAIDACLGAVEGLEDIVRLVVKRKFEVFFFGVIPGSGAGHFWSKAHGGSMSSRDGPVEHIDGVYAPPVERHREEPYGVARTVLVRGYTVVQWWDSSEDHRGGCNSSFVARGVHTFDEMMEAGREQHPKVLERFEAYYKRKVVSE